MSAVYKNMKAEIDALNVQREAGRLPHLACPAKTTLSRKIKALNQFEVHASCYGIAKARAKHAIVSSGLDVTLPLQQVQIDEWSIQLPTIAADLGLSDVLTAEERLSLQKERLKVCLVLDVATRCVLGFRVTSRGDAENAIETLARVVSDKNPIAKPEYENAPAVLPRLRGHIERVFSTMHTSLIPDFTGRPFTNVVDKDEYQSEKRALIFTKQLPNIFASWAIDVYHRTPHAGRRNSASA
jgi:putative transposase